ncbi:hypothetical protein ACH4S9_15625 [Streptomyces sp. NPDC021225]|uniref:hypothetical protein n=1 Tax=Streptomyces sp. NPDC021225 TaxID=3365121 RepID=UPI00379477F9
MDDLRYKMIMALTAADFGNPLCEQAADICAEIANQHCTQLHVADRGPPNVVPAVTVPPGARGRP